MKEMVAGFKDKYFSDSLSPEVRIYNGMNLIVVCGLLLSTVLIRLFFPTVRAFLVTYAAAATALYTVYIGNSTHKYEFHAIIMSCVLNFIFFPTIYFEYGKLYFCIPVYFIIGLMYNVFLLKRKTAVLITLTDIVA